MFRSRLLIFLVLALICAGINASAQTLYMENLDAAQLLVRDYLPSTGGCGPALSPYSSFLADGKYLNTIAYTDSYGEVWLAEDISVDYDISWHLTIGGHPEALWKLQCKKADNVTGLPVQRTGYEAGRNVDWSPDGKTLAFSYNDCRLYIADGISVICKYANVRPVAEIKKKDDKCYSVREPRWSPDGEKIAFVRYLEVDHSKQQLRPELAQIWILDVKTRTETMVANDLCNGYRGSWSDQPWSPDSKSLVYAAEHRGTTKSRVDIVVVSIDGKTRRVISGPSGGSSPSFHPKLNKVIFSGPVKYPIGSLNGKDGAEDDFSTSIFRIWMADADGKNPVVACPSLEPNEQQLKEVSKHTNQIASSKILSALGDNLTQSEKIKLQSDKLRLSEISDISIIAVARKISGDYLKATEEMLASKKENSKKYKQALAKREKIKDSLSQEERFLIYSFNSQVFHYAAAEALQPYGLGEFSSAISPDGSKLAFATHNIVKNRLTYIVYCQDTKTGKTHRLFEDAAVDQIKWSMDSKYLMIQSRRLVGNKWENITGDGYPEMYKLCLSLYRQPSRSLGYPEIWLLQPK